MPTIAGADDGGTGGLLLVTASLAPGGAERVLVHLAEAAAAHLPTTLVSLTSPDGARLPDVDGAVELVELGRPRVRGAAMALLRVIRMRRPSVLVTSQSHVSVLLALLHPFLPRGTTTVVREPNLRTGGGVGDRGVRLAHRTVYRAHALVLASSRRMAQDLARRRRGPIAVLPNPVDESGLRASAMLPPIIAGDPDPDGLGRRLVHVGRLVPGKRVIELIDAFATARSEGDRLILVGDGPERARIAAHVAALGLAEHVVIVGHDPAPERHMARADLLVLASEAEGMPNAVLEALAVGTPVLATEDLATLDDVRAAAPEGAVRLVPRSTLAASLAAASATEERTSDVMRGVRTSLLPPEHRRDAVVVRLLALAGVGRDAPA